MMKAFTLKKIDSVEGKQDIYKLEIDNNCQFDEFEKELGVTDGQTTKDDRFTLETVRCIGGCSLGPMVKINDDMQGRLSPEQIKKILDQCE